MAWETRRRGGSYYTRSRKVGGQVVREYIGTGLAAELIAEHDRRAREQRATAAAVWRIERERMDAAEAFLATYCQATDRLVHAELTAAGYHQHKRGEWRRARGQRQEQ
jgi:hypothetical protein